MGGATNDSTMNVGLYSGAAGMRVGQDYQQMVSENLSLQTIPGYKQTLPVFSTDPASVTNRSQMPGTGNPAAVRMTRVIDFSQGPMQPSGSPYHMAIQGEGFFSVREADGSTSFTRNGSFGLSAKGELITNDGATVLGKGSSPISINTTKGGEVAIGTDGTISIGGAAQGHVGIVHFDNPSSTLQTGAFGRFVANDSGAVKQGPAKNDKILQGNLEGANGNPIVQMANMIQAVRIYEANSKSMKSVDDNQNQLITTLGARPQG